MFFKPSILNVVYVLVNVQMNVKPSQLARDRQRGILKILTGETASLPLSCGVPYQTLPFIPFSVPLPSLSPFVSLLHRPAAAAALQ